VALEGKVVEHRHGYRAASATAISVVARSAERTLFTDDPRILAVLFDRPVDTIALFGEPADRWPDERIVTDLTMEERRQRWTSDPYSG